MSEIHFIPGLLNGFMINHSVDYFADAEDIYSFIEYESLILRIDFLC